jgi:hypothetical protein
VYAIDDDLLAHDPKVGERGAQGGEVAPQRLEVEVASRPVEDVVLREIIP